jgi:predicted RNase H-like HicB family nuclease
MGRFLVVIEEAGENYSAYIPDLPGCVATGKTREEVARNMRDAMEMHLQGLAEDDIEIPLPRASSEYFSVRKTRSSKKNIRRDNAELR